VRSDGAVWNAGYWVAGVSGPGPFGWNAGYPIPGAGSGFAAPGTAVAALARARNLVDLFVVRADGSIWNAGHWGEGIPGPGPFGWNPGYMIAGTGPGYANPGAHVTAISRGQGVVDLFVVRPDGAVWNAGHWTESAPGPGPFGWSPGYQISGPNFARPGSPIAVVQRDANHTDLFVVRPDGTVWNAGWWAGDVNGPGPFGWNPGYRIGFANTVDAGATVTGIARSLSHVDLFVAAQNGQIVSPWWDGSVR
jgi:hypothetical protein